AKANESQILAASQRGRLTTRDKTQNLSLKEITDTKGPVLIQFELRDKQTVMPLGDHAAPWSSYIREVIRGVPLYYPFWLNVPKEQKAALITDIGRSTRASSSTCKRRTIPTRLILRPSFRNIARAAQNRQNRAKSTNISQQGSRSLARLRDEMEDIRRLEAMGTYTDDEISRLARGGSSEGILPAWVGIAGTGHSQPNGSGGCRDEEEGANHQDDKDEDGDGDT
nr:hypothetical protein [Tanacetum cinerariifolium]